MKVTRSEKALSINENVITFDQRIDETVTLSDRVILRLMVDDFDVGDPLVGRNVLAFDGDGRLLWRIPPTGGTRSRPDGTEAPEAYFGLGLDDDGKTVKIGTPDGFEYDLDPETGDISNPVFTK